MAQNSRPRPLPARRVVRYRYEVDGSAALQPEYLPQEKPQRRRRRQPAAKPAPQFRNQQLEGSRVRQADPIAPMGVLGMVMAVCLAVMVLQSHIQLNSLNNQVVSLRSELSTLQETQDQLQAQYEQLFDLQSIESDMLNSGKMIKTSSSQQVYLDLSEMDEVITYDSSSGVLNGLSSLWSSLQAYMG